MRAGFWVFGSGRRQSWSPHRSKAKQAFEWFEHARGIDRPTRWQLYNILEESLGTVGRYKSWKRYKSL